MIISPNNNNPELTEEHINETNLVNMLNTLKTSVINNQIDAAIDFNNYMNNFTEINKINLIKNGISISTCFIDVLDKTIIPPFENIPLRFIK